jgi:glycosyltransferase involved in cell wall biosynthesis
MNRRARVVQVIYGLGVEAGGAGRFAMEIARRLDPEMFEAKVLALWTQGQDLEDSRRAQMHAHGVETFTAAAWDPSSPYGSFLAAVRGMRQVFYSQPPDILHSHSEFGEMALLPFAFTRPRPWLLRTVHNGHPREWRKRPLRRLLLSNFLNPLLFDREIGVNRGITSRLGQRLVARLRRRKGLFIPNAIDLARFPPNPPNPAPIRRELGLPEDALVVGTMGRLAEGKGFEDLLHAASRVCEQIPQTRFVFVGDGELWEPLHALVDHLGLNEQVLFTGPRDDVERILAAFDLFVSPSYWEGLSTVILESMAAGVPVVATDIPGSREIIKNEQVGWLVPPRSPSALSEQIQQALLQPEARERTSRQALAHISNFSIEAVVQQHEALYQQLLSASRPD